MSHYRILTKDQIDEAKYLKRKFGFTKRKLKKHFLAEYNLEVGETTIWENVFRKIKRPHRKSYFQTYKKPVRICIPCAFCEICMTKEFDDQRIPLNYQLGERCLMCYLKKAGLEYLDLSQL